VEWWYDLSSKNKYEMDAFANERRTSAAPSISKPDLDALIAEADKAKVKA